MNATHYHLVLNHFPIILPIVGFVILFMGIIFKSISTSRIALFIYIASALITLPVMYTGDQAEEKAESIPGIEEAYMHTHEEAAERFAIVSYIGGIIALATLIISYKKESWSIYLKYILLVYTLLWLYMAKTTGTTGGEIRHTEIRTTNLANTQNPSNSINTTDSEEGDDDE